jgi:hypothetical protein
MSPLAIFGTVLAVAATVMFFICRGVSHLDETRAEIDADLGDDAMALCRETPAETEARWARLGLNEQLSGLLESEGNR